jgi:DnaJ-domain-containing protein 1
MIEVMIQWSPETFQKSQWIMIGAVLLLAWFGFRSKDTKSQFRKRESDRDDLNKLRNGPDLAQAKISRPAKPEPKKAPLSLPGIRLHGAPHEILGIAENANEAEVMRAYKDAIKQYHPDRIQGQAQEQIKFYQEAASQLNQAKESMMQRLRGR